MELDALLDEIDHLIAGKTDYFSKSDLVYHYTDSSALLEIIKNDELWLTQREFMNDVYEKSYADGVLKKAFLLIDKVKGDANYHDFVSRYIPEINKQYIFSLSMEPDLVSQWNYYGGHDGYSIAFNRKSLLTFFSNQNLEIQSGFVIYDEEIQLEIFTTIIQYIKSLTEARNKSEEMKYIQDRSKAESALSIFHSLSKLKNNHPEKEYRIIVTNNKNTNFRSRNGIISPYTKINRKDMHLPIEEIMIGPGINDSIGSDGLQQYINFCQKSIRLTTSALRIRGTL